MSSQAQLAKILEIKAECPKLKHIIAFDADATGPGVTPLAEHDRAARRQDAAGEGRNFRSEALQAKPDDLVTIIYTSGTTGRPQGRDADPQQHLFELRRRDARVPDRARRFHAVVPAAVAHLRAHGGPLRRVRFGRHHQLRREHRHAGGEPRRDQADHRDERAARLREDLRPGAGERAGVAGEEAGSSSGPSGSARSGPSGRSTASRFPAVWPSSTRSPRSWCSGNSRRGGRAAQGSSCRAARRCRPTSPSSSSPPGCRSTRATASRRRHRSSA